MALFLISERAAGSTSAWSGYLQTLPDAPPSPLSWGAAERDLLAATQLLQSLQGYECALHLVLPPYFAILIAAAENFILQKHRVQAFRAQTRLSEVKHACL